MYWFILILIIIPAIEISLFIWIGSKVSIGFVFLLILLTGIVGVALVRYQGIETWKRAQLSMYNGEPPGDHILDGISIMIGAVLIITPGLFTDAIGLLLITPFTRQPFKKLLYTLMMKRFAKGKIIYRKW